jgi:serine/threonine protein kinase
MQDAFKYVPAVNIIDKSNTNNNKNRLHEVMNIAPGLSLEEYIIYLFNSTADNKKQLMIYVLQKITLNLLQLQNISGLIHGDLNEQNIFINQSDGSVLFIDFGRSTCRIPLNNNNYSILSMPVDENLSYKYTLDINKDYRLRGIDLFYLIEKLSRFRRDSFNNFDQFISIINQIKGNININQRLELFKVIYTEHFLSNPNIVNFYPENFIKNLETLLYKLQLNQSLYYFLIYIKSIPKIL